MKDFFFLTQTNTSQGRYVFAFHEGWHTDIRDHMCELVRRSCIHQEITTVILRKRQGIHYAVYKKGRVFARFEMQDDRQYTYSMLVLFIHRMTTF